MSKVTVLVSGSVRRDVEQYAIVCPFCHSQIQPEYLFMDGRDLFCACPNSNCNRHMVLTLSNEGHFTKVLPNAVPQRRAFSQIITEISSGFEEIYNQAFFAEQYALNQISGVGYRKALEFLIKDYLLSQTDDEAARENIKNKFLNNCIQDDVKNENIRQVARRAVWLGNDETHYVRKWADKDVSNLKQLIDLTIRWIENEVETRRVLAEM